jgi:hypothetical protein
MLWRVLRVVSAGFLFSLHKYKDTYETSDA